MKRYFAVASLVVALGTPQMSAAAGVVKDIKRTGDFLTLNRLSCGSDFNAFALGVAKTPWDKHGEDKGKIQHTECLKAGLNADAGTAEGVVKHLGSSIDFQKTKEIFQGHYGDLMVKLVLNYARQVMGLKAEPFSDDPKMDEFMRDRYFTMGKIANILRIFLTSDPVVTIDAWKIYEREMLAHCEASLNAIKNGHRNAHITPQMAQHVQHEIAVKQGEIRKEDEQDETNVGNLDAGNVSPAADAIHTVQNPLFRTRGKDVGAAADHPQDSHVAEAATHGAATDHLGARARLSRSQSLGVHHDASQQVGTLRRTQSL